MKKLMILALALILPLSAFAVYAETTTIEGTIQGYQCVTLGKTCPIGQEDPIAAAESIFVVLTENNNYYVVTNLDRVILARHINDRVKVTGEINQKYKSIKADSLDYFRDGKWVRAWDKNMERESLLYLY